nr:SCAN domain-containing protein 3-like [Neodiprion pinetum]
MRPNRLQRHLTQQHPTLTAKSKEFFSSKAEVLKRMKLDNCDESTDITNYAQLIVYVRYISGDIIEEEILYSQSLTAGTKSEDIFNSISDFIKKNDLDWNKLIGLCTDGAPVMIGVRSGLAQKLKEKNPSIVSTHCVIHRQALASKTLPQNLRQILDSAIQIVNYIRSSALNSRLFTLLCEDLDSDHRVLLFHTEVRWLSKGNMLARLYELKEEVILFLEFKEKNIFLQMFKNEQFQCKLAYLADIFDTLNQLNLKLQGQNGTSISNYDHIQGFISKLQLWDQKTLVSEFQHYYRDINSESPIWHMTRNPFVVDVLQLPEEVQEEFLEMKADSTMKDDFHLLTLEKFWIKRFLINPKVASLALRILLPFSSTYMCETGFSALVLIKTKQRNRLAVDSDLTITLAKTVPRIDKLVQNVQAQVSH